MSNVNTETCRHQPVYFGVINININERTVGSIDVWRCALCKKRFCEEKQLGVEDLAEAVGMPHIDSDAKWAVSVCKLQQGNDRWRLVKLKKDGALNHECLNEKIVKIPVSDYALVDDQHWSFLVDDYINEAVEI